MRRWPYYRLILREDGDAPRVNTTLTMAALMTKSPVHKRTPITSLLRTYKFLFYLLSLDFLPLNRDFEFPQERRRNGQDLIRVSTCLQGSYGEDE
jgi:hypothetical protein